MKPVAENMMEIEESECSMDSTSTLDTETSYEADSEMEI